jgi:hypothetical protein
MAYASPTRKVRDLARCSELYLPNSVSLFYTQSYGDTLKPKKLIK